MYKYICVKCNKEFETRKKGQLYCSKSCANSINTSRRKVEDYSIFSEGINEVSAYILGIIVSDGCLSFDKHSHRYRITISMNDLDVVEYLRSKYSPTKKLYAYKNPKGRCNTYTFITTNVYDIYYLDSIGITERKSKVIKIPIIEEAYENHMIRGVFDGDGSVYVNKTVTHYNNIDNVYYYINASFTTGSYEFAQQLNKILIKNNINSHIVKDSRENNECWYVKIYSKKDIELFYKYLYKDSTIYLKRKNDLFNMMI